MSAQNKILIGLAALIAFAIGFTLNMARVSDDIDTASLLSAELLVSDPSTPQSDNSEAANAALDATTSMARVSESLGELTLVNFWASWCAPCREEMPLFESIYRQANQAGFMVVGITLDSPSNAQPMLDSMDITYPILYAEETGISIMESVGNPQGLLPYSLLLDKDGKVIEQVLGQIHQEDISVWLAEHL